MLNKISSIKITFQHKLKLEVSFYAHYVIILSHKWNNYLYQQLQVCVQHYSSLSLRIVHVFHHVPHKYRCCPWVFSLINNLWNSQTHFHIHNRHKYRKPHTAWTLLLSSPHFESYKLAHHADNMCFYVCFSASCSSCFHLTLQYSRSLCGHWTVAFIWWWSSSCWWRWALRLSVCLSVFTMHTGFPTRASKGTKDSTCGTSSLVCETTLSSLCLSKSLSFLLLTSHFHPHFFHLHFYPLCNLTK